ncbi:MAG: TRAP transporter large permease [Betaproteobacteria bacterium]|nr:TRAP transporter large permease [Betaproteobacteria bacterium]
MGQEWIGGVGFGIVVLLIMLRVPVAIAMGVVGAVGYGIVGGFSNVGFVLGRAAFESVFPISLSVVPLFIMMGVFAAHGGMSRSLYNLVSAFVAHWRGGLAMATIGASAMFGAVCGSTIATAATIGRIAMPEMRARGYDDRLASASVAAGGTLGIMIPPSIAFVVYGLMTETSIGALFIAGIIPGILGAVLYMGAVNWMTLRNPKMGPAAARASWSERIKGLREVWQVVALFGVVLGGIYFGWFSPTEAASVGAFGAILMTAISGRLTWKVLGAGFTETAETTAMIFFILIGATILNYFIDATGLTQMLIGMIQESGWNRYWVLFLICVFYLILGCLMDSLSMILLTIGTVFPLIKALGFDPIWFGVILVTLAEIGTITPPVGMNLFVISAVVPNLPMQTIVRGILPFVMADVVRILVLVLIPGLAIWLPQTMGR